VKCWGYNGDGQVGDGTFTDRSTPVDVTGLTTGMADLDAGSINTCAVNTAGGVKCWGLNEDGGLGDGTTNASAVPVQVSGLTSGVTSVSVAFATCVLTTGGGVKCWGSNSSGELGDGTMTNSFVPVQVIGLTSGVSELSMASFQDHSCALTSAGSVKCWGNNIHGSLGNG
jgi:hypothetical protein